eukprot:1130328_1
MFYKKKLHAVAFSVYAFLSSPIYGSMYYVSTNPSSNYQCPDTSICHIYCDVPDLGVINHYNCSDASECHFHCDEMKCGANAFIYGNNANTLNITQSSTGEQCLSSANITAPNYGNASFETESKKGFKGMTVHAASNTNQIIIHCDSPIQDTDDCKSMNVYASTAQYLYISIGNALEFAQSTVECPVGSSYNGPDAAPCVFDAANGILDNVIIVAPQGIPHNVYVTDCLSCTNVQLQCDQVSSVNNTSLYPFPSSACWYTPTGTITTSVDEQYRKRTIHCPTDQPCHVMCQTVDGCRDTTIHCASGQTCDVTCKGDRSCYEAIIHAEYSSLFRLFDCATGSWACIGITLYVPPNNQGIPRTQLIGADIGLSAGSGMAYPLQFYAIYSWLDLNITTAPTFTFAAHKGTMHCGTGYTSTCDFASNAWQCANTDDSCYVISTAPPTVYPTALPTKTPTANPTLHPTRQPTSNPTVAPTINPTNDPTRTPTVDPSFAPTSATLAPTLDPITVSPTLIPTSTPTQTPTTTLAPTSLPTSAPSVAPTSLPTSTPTMPPTTVSPTSKPTLLPTSDPTTFGPTSKPTSNPISVSDVSIFKPTYSTYSRDRNHHVYPKDNVQVADDTETQMLLTLIVIFAVLVASLLCALAIYKWYLYRMEHKEPRKYKPKPTSKVEMGISKPTSMYNVGNTLKPTNGMPSQLNLTMDNGLSFNSMTTVASSHGVLKNRHRETYDFTLYRTAGKRKGKLGHAVESESRTDPFHQNVVPSDDSSDEGDQ